MATFYCSECNHQQEVSDEYIGRKVQCPKCQALTELEATSEAKALERLEALSQRPPVSRSTRPTADPSETNTARFRQLVIAALVLLVVVNGLSSLGIVSQNVSVEFHQTGWEYRIVSPDDLDLEHDLEKLGKDGWELVTARRAIGRFDKSGYEMIFKRPKATR